MIALGVILLVVGYVAGIAILWTIGIVLVVIGIILWILGSVGHAIGGRRHYWYRPWARRAPGRPIVPHTMRRRAGPQAQYVPRLCSVPGGITS
ncbi:hypothetical protein DRB96_10725 [Streptomyces sp. ICC1]|nr:hypothetical protein DRB89_11860 [Streptomyces sp. ICC4]AWZ12717.1 hypothetical protein DRB96_10725 [Streptomyces sp. ICC1]